MQTVFQPCTGLRSHWFTSFRASYQEWLIIFLHQFIETMFLLSPGWSWQECAGIILQKFFPLLISTKDSYDQLITCISVFLTIQIHPSCSLYLWSEETKCSCGDADVLAVKVHTISFHGQAFPDFLIFLGNYINNNKKSSSSPWRYLPFNCSNQNDGIISTAHYFFP